MKKLLNSESFSNKNQEHESKRSFIEIEERVRYSETDKMGIAHNKNYFEWFELGRTEYCRQKNISYKSIEEKGYYLVVVEAFCRYKKALRYDEKFIIRCIPKKIAAKKIIFHYELLTKRNKQLIASGYTVHVVTNSKAEVCPLPQTIVDKIKS